MENGVPIYFAKPNAIWAFFGHSYQFGLAFTPSMDGSKGWITNRLPENPKNQVYNLHRWGEALSEDIKVVDFVRLAYLFGCGTAGGTLGDIKNVDPEQSIAASFYYEGADAVVGWKDTLYVGFIARHFNEVFWNKIRRGISVAEALKEALRKVPEKLKRDRPHHWASIRKYKVWGGSVVLSPPAYGN